VPSGRIVDILNARRAISADTAVRLGRTFGPGAKFWLDLQGQYEIACWSAKRARRLRGGFGRRSGYNVYGARPMDMEGVNGINLHDIGRINVILGKNGSGKSLLLKNIENWVRQHGGFARYLSPERGGVLSYDPGIEQTIARNPDWLGDQRRRNQADGFRQQSTALFRRLERLALLEIEREHTKPDYQPKTFSTYVDQLNTLLDRVYLVRDDNVGFEIRRRDDDSAAEPTSISSGEAEAVSLGIEILQFVKEAGEAENRFLLIDEPDVHLHPDLQDRLATFLIATLSSTSITLIVATHSTAFVASLASDSTSRVAFMRYRATDIHFRSMTSVDRAILPIFGAHPLSNVFNQRPLLLVEGDDDERVWQQATRSSGGLIHLYPCSVGGLPHLHEYEIEAARIIEAVYDNARAFSVRDRDAEPEAIDNMGRVIRVRLACRTIENLLLTDDVLEPTGVTWVQFQELVIHWLGSNAGHKYFEEVQSFADTGFLRKDHEVKDIRNILLALLSHRPWEVLVGQAIARLVRGEGRNGEGSVREFLGARICFEMLGLKPVN
jgi:predicted ATPase